MRTPVAVVALLASTLALSCAAPSPPAEWVFQGRTMGTRYTVRVVDPGRAGGDEAVAPGEAEIGRLVQAELDAVDARMSTYKPDSELSRFNDTRSTEPFPVSAATYEVIEHALEVAEASGGALDVTVGGIVDAWGFGPAGGAPEPPTAAELRRLRAHAGWRKLELLPDRGAVRKRDPELHVDLSAVAKGYAVDRVARALSGRGFDDYMVEVGGEVRTRGTNRAGGAWRIGIESPEGSGVQRILPLSGRALATSGDYRNYWMLEGRRVSHTIDPRTARPVHHAAASVSVVADSCVAADAWATALLVLGPEEGLRRAEEWGLAALFLVHASGGLEERMTSAFEAILAPDVGTGPASSSVTAGSAAPMSPAVRSDTMAVGGSR